MGLLCITNSLNAMITAMNWIFMVNWLFHFGVVEQNAYSLIRRTFCPFICMFQFQNSTHFSGIWC